MASPQPPTEPVESVAAFDFDKTLSSRDCVVPFVRMCISRRRALAVLADVPTLTTRTIRRDRDSIKAIITRRAFAGMSADFLEETGRTFARRVVERWMRDDTLETLDWHKGQGHRTGIVSASYGHYLRPIGEHLGVDFVIATELEIDNGGCATGRLIDGNCRGPEKARRLRSWMAEHHLDGAVVHAYGDSSGDRELLQMAHHPHLVGSKGIL